MATILLSAVGAAIGAGFGGTILGLSGAVIGRALGASLGRVIDASLLGMGSAPVETGKVDRFRLMSVGEGAPVARVWGRVRLGGHVIWASRFQENVATSGKGLGGPRTSEYSYTVSLAIALCEGEIARVGRVWADGTEIERDSLNMRVYTGSEDQLPDPRISVVEGAEHTPAFRGIAYVVIEDLDLGRFGNRVPQFSFEVIRPAQCAGLEAVRDLRSSVSAVALMPGTGEYALATTRVHFDAGLGSSRSANVNAPSGKTDFATSLEHLVEEAPGCQAVSVVVSWFGDDLRCGECRIKPKVEQTEAEGQGQIWRAGGIGRDQAEVLAQVDGRVVYGGTPGDDSLREAIAALNAAGQAVMFYPFVLMEQLAGNGLPDPWTGADDQPVLPWRGRITVSVAPGREGSPDRTTDAEAEVAAFFGTAQPVDFSISDGQVVYSGPEEWSYRRFILHYAHLCAQAGGVEAFCVGSELRGLTQIRGAGDTFPAVAALRALLADLRTILGPQVKLSYAADWSEYFGYQSPEGNRYFHLDPLWADENADFIGIDNYMPLSDWREGRDHADAQWGSIYNLEYLMANVAGGEGFDWYYAHPAAAALQIRTPITDGDGEPWVWRYKDLRGWWENPHHDRVDGMRVPTSSPWVPMSKPFWFTELGCPAVDKGTNEPNVFFDPKSSESRLPKYSTGRRDDFIQMQYLRAMAEYWADPTHNPVSPFYEAAMVDTARAYVWAWDARPFPQFPARRDIWSDGGNYARGHWLSGRISSEALTDVVAEICESAGLTAYDVNALHGVVRGYLRPEGGTARAALQPLMMAHGFEAVDRDGLLVFRMRHGLPMHAVDTAFLAVNPERGSDLETLRAAEAEIAGRVRLGFVEAEADFEMRAEEAIFPDEETRGIAGGEVNLVLTRAEGRAMAERWLAEARVARDGARLSLPMSRADVGTGDVVDLGDLGLYRVDRAETAQARHLDMVRVEPAVYEPSDQPEDGAALQAFVPPVPVFPLFLDLPLLREGQDPVAPHLAVSALPWPGVVGLWHAPEDAGYEVNRLIVAPSVIGVTQTPLNPGPVGLWDRGEPLRIRLARGQFASASELAVLGGSNLLAIGDGTSDRWEIVQFATATPVGPGEWEIGQRLRGIAGSDGLTQTAWPAGSYVVVLDRSVSQIALEASQRGLARHYRVGVAARGVNDPAVVHRIEAFEGIGLRPYRPAHLRATQGDGDLQFSWVRRSRIDADGWVAPEVPLAESYEAYRVRVIENGTIRREVVVSESFWIYGATEIATDAITGAWWVEVAQISESYGPGAPAQLVMATEQDPS